MNTIKKLFVAPVFDDELKTQQAYLLNIIVWVLILVPMPFVLYTLVFAPENILRTMVQAGSGEAVNIFLLIMVRRGYVRAASILQVGAFWLFFTATALTGAGVQGEAYLIGYGVVIIIAGSLLGGRGALVMTTLSLLMGAYMVYAVENGILTVDFVSTPIVTWIVSLVLFPVSATLQFLGTRITRQALARARASEERYRLISEVSSDYTFSTTVYADGSMSTDWVAGAFERMTGFTFEEYVATGGWLAHLHPEDVELDRAAVAKLMQNQTAISEVRTFAKNGEVIYVRVYSHPIWNTEQNRLAGIIGAVQNIGEQKQAEEALRKSESIYRRAIEVAGGVPYHQTFDENGNIIYDFMSEGIRAITGYGPEEFTDELWDTLVFERHLLAELESYVVLQDAIDQVRNDHIPIWKCEHHIRARDGQIHWVFEAAVDLRDEHGIAYGSVGMYQDITERKKAEETLKYERDLLQIFLDNIPDTVYFKDASSRFVRINDAEARVLGVSSPQEAIGKTDLDFLSAELAESFLQEERKIVETGEPLINRVEYNPTPEGKARWFSATKVPVRDTAGDVIGIIGISRDITEQKLAQRYEQNRRVILENVLRLGQEVTEVKDLHTTLKRIWHGIRYELNFDRTGLYLYDPDTNSMNGTYGTDNNGDMIDEWQLHIALDNPDGGADPFNRALQDPENIFLTRDYERQYNQRHSENMHDVKDFVAAAARAGDKPVAVICADQVISGRRITSEQLEALRLFAGYAGLAIENSRLNDALQVELRQQKQAEEQEANRRSMLEKVLELGKLVTETADINTTLKRIWHGVHDVLGFDRLGVFLYNEKRISMDSMIGTDVHGNMEDTRGHWYQLSEWSNFKVVLENPDGLFFTHSYDEDNDIPEDNEMYGVKDYAAVAAWAGDKPVAIISVDQLVTKRSITPEQLEALRLFAGYAALAIQNAQLNDVLEEDLAHRQTLISELEAKNAELERFTYTVSHDLKSPLVTITGFLGFIEKDALAGDTAKIKSSIERISRAAQKMQRLLNDLLELSRIGRLMNQPENVPFQEIVRESLDQVRGRLEANSVRVEVEENLPIIHGDKIRLIEVVQNLVDNAAKFTKGRPDPCIKIGPSGVSEKGLPILFVSDNGIGIAPQYHEKIFGLFDKLDPNVEGTGVGLTLVKRIIEVHGGKIWLESQPGVGTTFYFTLPGPSHEE